MSERVLLDVRRTRPGSGVARVIDAWRPHALDDPDVVLLEGHELVDSSPDPREPRALRAAMKAADAALLHPVYPYVVLPRGVRSLVMLHDTLQIDAGGLRGAVFNRLIRWNLRQSAGVLTVSESAKASLVDRLDLDPDLVHVAHNGVVTEPAGTPAEDPYVLYVGNVKPHKHVPELLTWAPEVLGAAGLRLIAVVPDAAKERLAARAPAGVELRANVSDDDLGVLRRHATFYVSLAEGEGFGLPPLEAAAAGVPSVLHDSGAHREVCGTGASYCTLDRDHFRDAVQALLRDRATYAAAAHARAHELTWDASWASARAAQRAALAR